MICHHPFPAPYYMRCSEHANSKSVQSSPFWWYFDMDCFISLMLCTHNRKKTQGPSQYLRCFMSERTRHYNDKTVSPPPYLYDRNPCTVKWGNFGSWGNLDSTKLSFWATFSATWRTIWPLLDSTTGIRVPSNGGTLDAGVTLDSTKLSFWATFSATWRTIW